MFRNLVLQNFPFLEDDFDALTDYELFCKLLGYVKKVHIDNERFINQITVKLEQMYNEGKFDSLIEEIVNLQALFIYNAVSDMKSATNLVNGSHAKTLGYYSINDGGESYYLIRTKTNDDVIDDIFIVSLSDNDLVAELLVKDRLINVKQGGVTGSNLDNNTNKLAIIFSKGYDMYFPIGTYNIDNSLTLTSHKIYGENSNSTIIKFIGLSNSALITSNNLSNVEIRNIKFDFGDLQDELVTYINLFNTTGLNISNCEFKGGYGSQLRLNGSSNVLIENCNFHDILGDSGNPGECIYCNGITDLTVNKCKCNNVQDHFLYLDGSTPVNNVYINNCNLKYTGKDNVLTNGGSLAIYGNCNNIFINDNIIYNCKNGINIDIRNDILPNHIYLNNNTIYNSAQDGCFIGANNVNIHSNSIYNNGQDGLNIRNSNNIIINNNSINNNGRSGIASRNTNHITLNNNEIYDNSTVGVTLGTQDNLCNHVYINSCNIYKTTSGTQATGLQLLYGDDFTILNCKCYNNTLNYDTRRATTTNVTILLNGSGYSSNINSIEYADDIPQNGAYKKGDIVIYNEPTAGDYIGAVCVTSGAPGTWKEFGSIEL